jgi:hypothetical protein
MKVIDADWYETLKALQAAEEQQSVKGHKMNGKTKLTAEQLKAAVDRLALFFAEYQRVDKHNADAIVEYEDKAEFLAIGLGTKKFGGLSSYSLLDLLNPRAKQPCESHKPTCILNHDYVGKHDCVIVCTQCRQCIHGLPFRLCSNCTVVQRQAQSLEV